MPPGVATDPALIELYQREYSPMVRVAYLIVGSNALAEEIVQDAFVQVYRRWSNIESVGAYLRRTVVNGALSLKRRRAIEARQPVAREVAREVAVDAPEDDGLRDALATLPIKQRAAVVLRYYVDLSDEDIAATIGVRRATVRSLVQRGLQQLRIGLA